MPPPPPEALAHISRPRRRLKTTDPGTQDPRNGPGRGSLRGPVLLTIIAVALVAGIVLRVWILTSKLGPADSDEAIAGLMARHFLHGHVSAFFWGQEYGGSLEQVAIALVFAVLGTSSFTMKLVPLISHAVAAALVWRIGNRVGGTRVGLLAAALFWVGPAQFVWMSTKERGFYASSIVLSLVVVLEAVRIYERPRRVDAIILGAAAGLGWYASPQTLYVFVPLLCWLIVVGIRERRSDMVRLLGVTAPAAVVGALPWLVANIRSRGASLALPGVPQHLSYLARLRLVYTTGLPISLGVRVPYSGDWLLPAFGWLIYLGLVALLVAAVADWLRPGRRVCMTALLVLVLVVAYPFLEAIPATSFYVIEPRYLYLLSPFVALLAALLLSRRGDWVQVLALLTVGALSVFGLASMMRWAVKHPSNYNLIAADDGALLTSLRAEGVRSLFADYWLAYRIDLDSHEEITAASLGVVRYSPYQTEVRQSNNPAYVVMRGSALERGVTESLNALGIRYRRRFAGEYVVLVPSTRVLPEELHLSP